MKQYLGVKLIDAEPWLGLNGKCIDLQNEMTGEEVLGYKVVYEDGYTSWSPKDVFEKAYRVVPETLAVKTGNNLPSHQERVVTEYSELLIKVEALSNFINSNPIFQGLEEAEKERLMQQHLAMSYYLIVLKERIENFK